VDYLLSGIFSRACKALGGASDRVDEIAAEAGQLRGLLSDKLMQVLVNLEGGFPSLHDNLWLGGGEGEAVATALVPKLNKTRDAVEKLLFEVGVRSLFGCLEGGEGVGDGCVRRERVLL